MLTPKTLQQQFDAQGWQASSNQRFVTSCTTAAASCSMCLPHSPLRPSLLTSPCGDLVAAPHVARCSTACQHRASMLERTSYVPSWLVPMLTVATASPTLGGSCLFVCLFVAWAITPTLTRFNGTTSRQCISHQAVPHPLLERLQQLVSLGAGWHATSTCLCNVGTLGLEFPSCTTSGKLVSLHYL
jgi:hypothetical protein